MRLMEILCNFCLQVLHSQAVPCQGCKQDGAAKSLRISRKMTPVPFQRAVVGPSGVCKLMLQRRAQSPSYHSLDSQDMLQLLH